jgi:hypothetical protein
MNDNIVTNANNIILTKRCITCHIELPLDAFGIRRSRSNKPDAHWIYSRYGECLECTSERKAKWRKLHPVYMHNYYLNNKQLNKVQ